MKLCCKILGTAITATLPRIANENSFVFSPAPIFFRRSTTNSTASTQLTPWQRNVAHATPATPILNAATNRISIPIFATDEQARKTNGVLESPSAEKMPVAIL